jgi:hypothetical protein
MFRSAATVPSTPFDAKACQTPDQDDSQWHKRFLTQGAEGLDRDAR